MYEAEKNHESNSYIFPMHMWLDDEGYGVVLTHKINQNYFIVKIADISDLAQSVFSSSCPTFNIFPNEKLFYLLTFFYSCGHSIFFSFPQQMPEMQNAELSILDGTPE